MPPVIPPNKLRERVCAVLPEVVDLRHALHRIPEPGFHEKATAARIREEAARTRLRLLPPLVETDTVGILDGKAPGACVLLRADLDALPVEDRTGTPWASTHPGWSHACGHDGHTAMLLGALKVLDGLTDRFSGHVQFVFQPAEERKGGGRKMVQLGLLTRKPTPCAAFALHGWPGLETGRISSKPGPMMAAQDRFSIRLTGRGGHGAKPHTTIDPVVLAGQVILALQTIPSRVLNALSPAVLSICTVHGGTASNIIPDQVEMTGTLRYLDKETRGRMVSSMDRIVRNLAESAGARGEFELHPGYIALRNDPKQTDFAAATVRAYLGKDAWENQVETSMGAEDFSYYLKEVPGAFLRVGVGKKHAALHNPAYDFDDSALENGMITLVALALETLARNG